MNRKSDHRNFQKKMYLPTPAEIAAVCREIQSGWTPDEEEQHRTQRSETVVSVQIVRERDMRNE